MSNENFLNTQTQQQNYDAVLENCERYLEFLKQDLEALKQIENPSHAHFILARIFKDNLQNAVNTLK